MSVSVSVANIHTEMGTGDFLQAFFSTVSGNLEPEGWGTRFAVLMNELYKGQLEAQNAAAALAELRIIKTGLTKLSPDKVIWNIEDRAAMPPWGDAIAEEITDLGNYFVTCNGLDLISELEEILEYSVESGLPVTIG